MEYFLINKLCYIKFIWQAFHTVTYMHAHEARAIWSPVSFLFSFLILVTIYVAALFIIVFIVCVCVINAHKCIRHSISFSSCTPPSVAVYFLDCFYLFILIYYLLFFLSALNSSDPMLFFFSTFFSLHRACFMAFNPFHLYWLILCFCVFTCCVLPSYFDFTLSSLCLS